MAATHSFGTAIAVAVLYLAYHGIESYLIAPRVYGGKLCLSNLAVILAFAVGAEVGGALGAILAMPAAALYPTVERIWLKEYLAPDAITEHERLYRAGCEFSSTPDGR
jgi:predicted PurR-regulated permease PerM